MQLQLSGFPCSWSVLCKVLKCLFNVYILISFKNVIIYILYRTKKILLFYNNDNNNNNYSLLSF